MQLSKRLLSLAELVTCGNRLADVGTDHGYVPIYLLEKGRIPSAIAMDINQGPLDRAREHIRQHGYEAYIETRRSDGLYALKKGEADTVLIAGMGGGLVKKILEEGRQVLETIPEWILQPQSELHKVRGFLAEQGYGIIKEHMVYEDGKYYPIIKAGIEQTGDSGYTEAELYFGKACMQQDPHVLLAYLEKSLKVQGQILEALRDAKGEQSRVRCREVERMTGLLEECRIKIRERGVAEV